MAAPTQAVRAEAVDLALVLAVDGSSSVDDSEMALQLGGIAQGFRDAEVQQAIASGPLQRIAVSLVLWSEPQARNTAASRWYVIANTADALAFADTVERFPRSIRAASTAIGHALFYSARHIQLSGLQASRRVIDVSGDGEETPPRDFVITLPHGRAAAAAAGVTVNGLAITNDVADLHDYYQRQVITGTDAFALSAKSFADFATAMRRKLIREIEYRPNIGQRPGRIRDYAGLCCAP